MKIYYDFLIKDNVFSFHESQKRVHGSAYSTLKKIEYILAHFNQLTYQGGETDMVRKLKRFAGTIVNQYQEKEKDVHWFVRWLFGCCLMRKARRIEEVYQSIKSSAAGALEHPKAIIGHMLGYLGLQDIANFSAVNKQTHAIADPIRQQIEWPFRDQIKRMKALSKQARDIVLYDTARYHDSKKMLCLLILGANPNRFTDNLNDKALHWAVYFNKVKSVALLLKYRACIDHPGYEGRTPFVQAYQNCKGAGYLEMMRLLLENGADPNSRDNNGDPLLVRAIVKKESEVVKLLLLFKADLEQTSRLESAALHVAAAVGDLPLINTLLEMGAKGINQPGNLGFTPLGYAYWHANPAYKKDTMKLLLEKRADPNCRDKNTKALVDEMAKRGDREFLELMIDHGAEINLLGNGKTPLGWACSSDRSNLDVVRLLLERGANPHLPMQDGCLAVQIAERCRRHEIADLLWQFTPKKRSECI